ncbi:MAG: peptidase U32 family protein, partial [Clostridia bacterium]
MFKTKNIEILAPVGSKESLSAAVFSGADAVYLGASTFSARDSATNFENEELKNAVEFCHERDVKVFVAVNTLIKDIEFLDILNLVDFLCEIAVDALIVQDMGLFYILKKSCPNMHIHCSTQMSIMSISAVKL